jgi:hypothetical protein
MQLAFLTKAKKEGHFGGGLSTIMKDSRQFKQREKRFLKVVTCNTKNLYSVVRRLSNVGEILTSVEHTLGF